MTVSVKFERTIRALEENAGDLPLYRGTFPDIYPNDWVMLSSPNWGNTQYGEVLQIITDFTFLPGDAVETYEIKILSKDPNENKIVKCWPQHLLSHYSPKSHKNILNKIVDKRLSKDMKFVTELIMRKKTNMELFWN
jgi:hypothetical protein